MQDMEYQPEELIPLVADLAAAYTGYEHSSITYERAEMLMEAVLYCINECQDAKNYELSAGPVPAKEAYESGLQTVIQKTRKLQELYNDLIPVFQDYGLECLRDVIADGIPVFLLNYDARFAPQETLLTYDYPVLKDLGELSGVDAVLEYVECICMEQRFLRRFEGEYIMEILKAYALEYEVLAENICSIALPSIMAHVILRKPLSSVGFGRGEYEALEGIFVGKSKEDLERYFMELLKRMVEYFFEPDEDMLEYLRGAMGCVAERIYWDGVNHCLERVFLI